MKLHTHVRGLILILAASLFLILPAAAHAYPTLEPSPQGQRVVGMVAGIQGQASAPNSLTLQLGLQTMTVKVVPHTVIAARSTEADVEGLLVGDYALVTTQSFRKNRMYTARRITYDVQPFPPLKSIDGSIVRESPDGKRFLVKMTNAHTIWCRTSLKLTRYEEDGKVVDVEPVMVRAESVQVLGFHQFNGWIAADVSLVTSRGNSL